MRGHDPTRLTVIASIALLCAGALILIVMTLVGSDSNDTGARALGTALTAVFFLLTATAGATLSRGRADLAWFGWLTAILSVAALAGVTAAIWGHPSAGQGKTIGVAAVLALAGAHASLLLDPPTAMRPGRSAGCATRLWRCWPC
jgi:peptidoglycan/LPS O-acetylase OafA/YrhL